MKKIILSLICFTSLSLSAQPKKSPYEFYGLKNDSLISIMRLRLFTEYAQSYARSDTNLLGRIVTEFNTEESVINYRNNDSFQYIGRKSIDSDDSSRIYRTFDRANYWMDKNWSQKKMWLKNPGRTIYPKYKYIFVRVIMPNTEFRSTFDDSVHVYSYDAINFSKYENFCAKSIIWSRQLYPSKNHPNNDTGQMLSVKPLHYLVKKTNTEKKNHLKVFGNKATLVIKDHKTVDGDVITIYLNGYPIRKKLKITGTEVQIKLKLFSQYENDILIHVDDEGKYKPCTVQGYIKETGQEFHLLGRWGEELHLILDNTF